MWCLEGKADVAVGAEVSAKIRQQNLLNGLTNQVGFSWIGSDQPWSREMLWFNVCVEYGRLAKMDKARRCNRPITGSSPVLTSNICRCGVMANTSAFQADDAGSIPVTCSRERKGEQNRACVIK